MTSQNITSNLKSCVAQWGLTLHHQALVVALNQARVASVSLIVKCDSEIQ